MLFSGQKMQEFLSLAKDREPLALLFAEKGGRAERRGLSIIAPRLILVLEGSKHIVYSMHDGGCETELRPGECLCVPSSVWVEEFWDRPQRTVSVVFQPGYVRVIFVAHDGCSAAKIGPDVFFHTDRPLPPEGRGMLELLLQMRRSDASARHLLLALLEVVATMLTERDYRKRREDEEWARIQEIVQANFGALITMNDIASIAQVHPARLARLIRKRRNQSFLPYLLDIRMENALERLKDEQASIKEIAAECGFSCPNYFVRVFSRIYGLSPGRYRKRYFRYDGDGVEDDCSADTSVEVRRQ